jgi:hypothetical protein
MKSIMPHRSTTRLALFLGVLTVIAYPSGSGAAPCDGVPHCAPQVMAPVHYSAWQTSGWAYYCTGDHPYYWNNDSILGFGNNFSFDNSCFSVIENPFAEGNTQQSKMDATITNWCLKGEDITVTLGCSQQPQQGPSCPGNNTTVGPDPGCPMQGSPANHCSNTNPPVCIQTWTEQCADGPAYCTDDLLSVWCIVCQQ